MPDNLFYSWCKTNDRKDFKNQEILKKLNEADAFSGHAKT